MSTRNPTYYEVLGLKPNAKHTEVGLAYNRLSRALRNEDAPPDLKAESRLREAFEVLSDLDRRAEYDRKLLAARVKPAFGRNHAAMAALFLVAVGAGLYWYLRPQLAPESVDVAAAPGKPFQVGAGSWPLSVSAVPAKQGDRVYATQLTPKGEVVLREAKVKAVKPEGKSVVLDVSVPLLPQHGGAPLLDIYGRVVAVANMPPGGKGHYVAIPPTWGETVKLPTGPKPYKGGDEPPPEEAGKGGAVDDLGVPLETRKKQEELANKIDPERRKRLEKAFRPPPNVPNDL